MKFTRISSLAWLLLVTACTGKGPETLRAADTSNLRGSRPSSGQRKLVEIFDEGGIYGYAALEEKPVRAAEAQGLVVQKHWDFTGQRDKQMHMRFVPGGNGAVVTTHKNGDVLWFDSVDQLPQDAKYVLNMREVVYSNRDHGVTGFAWDPNFEANHFAYMLHQAQPGRKQLPNQQLADTVPYYWGPGPSNWWDDSCPQLGDGAVAPNHRFCEHWAVILRFEVNVQAKQFLNPQTLLVDTCGASETHGSGQIKFAANGDMVLAFGDGSQYDSFARADGSGPTQDIGFPEYDACFDSSDPIATQGQFRAQRQNYMHGKVVRILQDSYRQKNALVKGVDYSFIGKGFRNPFWHYIDPNDDTIYIADVGSAENYSERLYKAPLPAFGSALQMDGGWPCVEGIPDDGPNEAMRKEYLFEVGMQDLCVNTYNKDFNEPFYMYRNFALDPNNPTLAAGQSASVTGIFKLPQGHVMGDQYSGKTFFSDLTKGGLWYFDQDSDEYPHVLLGGVSFVDVEMDPATGIMYFVDHERYCTVAVYTGSVAVQGPPPPPPPPLPPADPIAEANMCFSPFDYPQLKWAENLPEGKAHTATLSIGVVEYDAPRDVRVRTRAYNGMMPGPLLVMQACETYHITLQNRMQGFPAGPNGGWNTFQHPYDTNLHTHGLHVAPAAPGDDPKIEVLAGEEHEYVITIPCDHVGGLHWYHPHMHGAGTLQAGGGALGLLVVEDNPWLEVPYIPQEIRELPLAYLAIQALEPSLVRAAALGSGDAVYQWTPAVEGTQIRFTDYLVNGCPGEEYAFDVKPGWTRLRMLYTAQEKNVIVEIIPIGDAPQPTLALLGKDGIYLENAPRIMSSTKMFFSLSSRVDVAVRFPSTAVGASYTLQIHSNGATDFYTLATVTVVEGPHQGPTELQPWNLCRPYYLMDLHESEEDSEVIGVDLRENINGVKFPKPVDGVVAPAFDMKYDAVQSWNLNGVKDHPGHLHVQHMQLQDVYNWDEVPDWFETGEWVDTVALDGTPTVKFRTDRFGGDYFFHCHIFAHADYGVMSVMHTDKGPHGLQPSPAFEKYGTCRDAVRTVGRAPGIFKAASYDLGGEGRSYHDVTPENEGGAGSRYDYLDDAFLPDAVDLVVCPTCDGGLGVGFLDQGEYLRYTIEIDRAQQLVPSVHFSKTAAVATAGGAITLPGEVFITPGACFAQAPVNCNLQEGKGLPFTPATDNVQSAAADAGVACVQLCIGGGMPANAIMSHIMLVRLPICGDEILDEPDGEECDEGADNDDAPNASCRSDCTLAKCGDGIVDSDNMEVCDEGASNGDTPTASCNSKCSLPSCGDGILNESIGEQCDEGDENSNTANASCRTTCAPPRCGDKIVDDMLGEMCDEGARNGSGSCTLTCELLEPPVEPAPVVEDKTKVSVDQGRLQASSGSSMVAAAWATLSVAIGPLAVFLLS